MVDLTVAELLAASRGLDEAAFLATYTEWALVVEPYVSEPARQTALTRRLSRAELEASDPLSAEATAIVSRAELERAHERAQAGELELEGGWRRTTEGFLHPQARIHWLAPGAYAELVDGAGA